MSLGRLLPFLQRLIKDAQVQPSPEDLALLSTVTTGKELATFLDHFEKGKSAEDTYRDMLRELKCRQVHSKAKRICAHCNTLIEGYDFMCNGDISVKVKCFEAYLAATARRCDHCQKPMLEGYMELLGDSGHAKVHKECVMAYKKATRPKCAKCEEPIMDNQHSVIGKLHYHSSCTP